MHWQRVFGIFCGLKVCQKLRALWVRCYKHSECSTESTTAVSLKPSDLEHFIYRASCKGSRGMMVSAISLWKSLQVL